MKQVLQLRIWPVQRTALADFLPGAGPAPPWNDHFPTPVDHVLLAALRSWISDPDDQPERWLRFGAPAGLTSIPLARGVFPAVDHAPAIDPCDLCVDEDVFTNYAGVDQDEVAQVEVFDLHRRGLLEAFHFGVLTKVVGDKVKIRIAPACLTAQPNLKGQCCRACWTLWMTSWFSGGRRPAMQVPTSSSSISPALSSSFLWLGKNADSSLYACVVSSSCSKFVPKALLPRPWSEHGRLLLSQG